MAAEEALPETQGFEQERRKSRAQGSLSSTTKIVVLSLRTGSQLGTLAVKAWAGGAHSVLWMGLRVLLAT